MDQPRRTSVVAGEVIPPQTFLHKVAPAPRADPLDDTADDLMADDVDTDAEADTATEAEAETEAAPARLDATAETETPAADEAEPDAPETPDLSDAAPDLTAAGPDVPEETHDEPPPAPIAEAPPPSPSWQSRPGDVPADEGRLLTDGPEIREQWMRVQAVFVDDPRASVTAAANVVAEAAVRLEGAVRARQQGLRERWEGNGHADTEALRVTMQRYRQLLERLAEL